MNELTQNLFKLQMLEFSKSSEKNLAELVADLRGRIPAPILLHYDRLKIHGKMGVVAVRNQVCSGCHMRLTLAVILTLKHEQDIQLCDNCSRYLYLPDEEPSPMPVVTTKRKPVKVTARRSRIAST